MEEKKFKALVVREVNGSFKRSIEDRQIKDLPDHDTLINVKYAALNYKDALSASGHKGVTKLFPHTPGVDAAGIVVHDRSGKHIAGEEVIVTGYDLGMNTSGAFAEYIKVPSQWIISKPGTFTMLDSMILGTGGFTAGLALYKMMLNGQEPSRGPVLVSGASGGVGSVAVGLLAKTGFEVIASSGKKDQYDHLKHLGADKVIDREVLSIKNERPLGSSSWAGAIDTVGGETLVNIIKSTDRNGNVAVCGLVESDKINLTVYPLILRGVNLLGIDSAECPYEIRSEVWQRLAGPWRIDNIKEIGKIISLENIIDHMDSILVGKSIGRVVVEI